jgi:iron complex outermembrane receptor protein
VPYRFDDPARAGETDKADLGTYADIQRGTGEIILKNSYEKLKGSTQIYTNLGHHRFYDGFESRDYTVGLSAYQNWLYSDQLTFAGGLDLMEYGGKAENDFAKLPNGRPIVNPDEHQLTSVGMYLLGFYSPLEILHFKAGLRYQYNSAPLTAQISPVAGAAVNPLKCLKIFANYQNGFRNPTIMELYLFPSANESLTEESVNSFESGASYLWNQDNSIRITYFKNHIENMIQSLPNLTPPPPSRFINSGSADQWGVEAKLRMLVIKNSGFQISYSYLEPDQLTAYNPKNQIKYMIFTRYNKFALNIYGKYIQDLYADNNFNNHLPDYNVLNLYVSYDLKDVKLYAKGLNLLNETYYVLPNYAAPGFQARFGMIFKF